MSDEKEFGFVRGGLIEHLSTLDYYKRTQAMIKTLDEQIEHLGENVGSPGARQFKNPREETRYLHDVKTVLVLKRQQERLKQKLAELQERVNADIEASKCVTPLKPLKKL